MISWRPGVNQYESVKLRGAVVMGEVIPTPFQAFPPGTPPGSHREDRENPGTWTWGGE